MIAKLAFVLSFLILLGSSDCDPQKQDDKIRALEADVKQLKTDIADLKQKQQTEHHYELRSEGFRTWRFDPATGNTCIQLTSPADWKRKDTKAQSCACSDYSDRWLEMAQDTDQQKKSAENYYNHLVRPACGD